MSLLGRKPWLLVILAFIILIAATVYTIVVAVKHQPESIPVPTSND